MTIVSAATASGVSILLEILKSLSLINVIKFVDHVNLIRLIKNIKFVRVKDPSPKAARTLEATRSILSSNERCYPSPIIYLSHSSTPSQLTRSHIRLPHHRSVGMTSNHDDTSMIRVDRLQQSQRNNRKGTQ